MGLYMHFRLQRKVDVRLLKNGYNQVETAFGTVLKSAKGI
jgi:hypothetical protein